VLGPEADVRILLCLPDCGLYKIQEIGTEIRSKSKYQIIVKTGSKSFEAEKMENCNCFL
jgi:hypothetical protein